MLWALHGNTLLRMARNTARSSNSLASAALEALARRLPDGWRLLPDRPRKALLDLAAKVRAPDGSVGVILVETKARLDPRDVYSVAEKERAAARQGPMIVVSPYLSPGTRERLKALGIGHLDLTGNAWIVVARPGLFIETSGATQAPDRALRPARSLRGAKAGRVVRALVDRRSPPGVRELAGITGVDAGYVSRLLAFLDSEALVRRSGRGRIESVDWSGLIRRWAREAPLESRGEVRSYLEPRGLRAFLERLAGLRETYAVTGSLAAERVAPVAPPRLAIVWVRGGEAAAVQLGLRPAETGANVLVIDPGDDGVFEGAWEEGGVRYAAPSQAAADLLTSPGRGPAEGEALLDWMQRNEDAWRG